MNELGKLLFFCGKMGSGKTTLSKEIEQETNSIRLSEDEWLEQLFPDEEVTLEDYVQRSRRIRPLVKQLAQSLLKNGQDVVMDFPANTIQQRQWLRGISDEVAAAHTLYQIQATDELCLSRIAKRANPKTDTIEMFNAMKQHFTTPSPDENLTVVPVDPNR